MSQWAGAFARARLLDATAPSLRGGRIGSVGLIRLSRGQPSRRAARIVAVIRRGSGGELISSSARWPGTMVIGTGNEPDCLPAMPQPAAPALPCRSPAARTRNGDVLVLVDQLDDLLGAVALADDLLRLDGRGERPGDVGETAESASASSIASARMMFSTPIQCLKSAGVITNRRTSPPVCARRARRIEQRLGAFRRVVDDHQEFSAVPRLARRRFVVAMDDGATARAIERIARAGVLGGWQSLASAWQPIHAATNPSTSFTPAITLSAIARARSAPSASTRSIWPGSASSRFISAAIGVSLATARSASAGLKVENCAPANLGEHRLARGIGKRGVDVDEVRQPRPAPSRPVMSEAAARDRSWPCGSFGRSCRHRRSG